MIFATKPVLLYPGRQSMVLWPLLYNPVAGTDPENLHGRWLAGWLPIVNYTGAKGVAD